MPLQRLARLLIVTDIYASLIAAAVPLISAKALGLPFDAFLGSLVFFQALAIYALNRQVDRSIDEINNPDRTAFVSSNGRLVLAFALAGFALTMAWAAAANMALFLLLSANFIASLFYSFPLLPKSLGFTRFKEALAGKNVCVGAMYAVFTLVPVFAAHAPITAGAAALFLFILARFFIVSTVFDMRDVGGDAKLGISTIPAAFGRRSALISLHVLNAFCLALSAASFALGFLPAAFLAMASATSLFALLYLVKCSEKGADLRFVCGVVAEADVLPAAAIALFMP